MVSKVEATTDLEASCRLTAVVAYEYKRVPIRTTVAPNPSPGVRPCPKYHTLMQRESAFRVVRMRFVVTALTSCSGVGVG